MRKFVSAVTSLAIAATAMSGTMMFSASAADTTIFEFRSGDSNSITVTAEEVAAGEVTIPVTLYVPASSGFNTAALKMSINGGETVGQYAGETVNGVEHTEYHFGNYGIRMETYATGTNGYKGFCDPCALDGGQVDGFLSAGYADWVSPVFVPDSFNLNYQHTTYVMNNMDVDAYAPYEESGTSGVTNWDETESWAYKYGMAEFNLILPQNLAEGTYVLDIYKERYVNIVSIGMDELVYGQSSVSGVNGDTNWTSRALTITVGDGVGETTTTTTTTTASETTTTTTTSESGTTTPPTPGDGVVYTFDTVTVEPGAEATVNLTISGDPGTGGVSLYFQYDPALTLSSVKQGAAYRISATINNAMETADGNNNVVAYLWAASTGALTAADGATVLTFTFTAPTEPGTYNVGLLEDMTQIYDGVTEFSNDVNNFDGQDMPFTVVPGAVIVEGEVDETTTTTTTASETTTTTTTTVPGDGVVYTFDTVTVEPGAEATVNLTISGDPGTGGVSLYFQYDPALTLSSVKQGAAYRISATINNAMETADGNNNVVAYLWAASTGALTAADGATVLTFTFTAPTEPGTYNVGLLEDMTQIYDGVTEFSNDVNNFDGQDMPFTVVPGAVIVEGDETTTTTTETTTTTTETTTTTTETTTTTTETTTTTTTTSTTPPVGEIFWGDVDCDQDVDIADVVRLNKFNAGNADVSEQGQLNADCEYDGVLDAADALAIKKYLAHLLAYEDLGDQ